MDVKSMLLLFSIFKLLEMFDVFSIFKIKNNLNIKKYYFYILFEFIFFK